MTITAKVIEDSILYGRPIRSVLARYPRFIHSELMTHRMFSRNASSSRAIPFWKQFKTIRKDPATFVEWGANQPGMQASVELEGSRRFFAQLFWFAAMYSVMFWAVLMSWTGVHKQIINRMLEPWTHINVLITATEWDNFFELRAHPAAQPEIRELAYRIQEALNASEPVKRKEHLPFIAEAERQSTAQLKFNGEWYDRAYALRLISAARCARLSYYTFGETATSIFKDMQLAQKLLSSKHMSPFEHAAIALKTPVSVGKDNPKAWRANFFGWCSFRWTLEHP